MKRIAALLLLFISISGCTAPPAQGTGTTTGPAEAATLEPPQGDQAVGGPPPRAAACQGEVRPQVGHYTLRDQGVKVEMVWASGFVPWWVRPAPDGRILAVSDGGDAIYEVQSDGALAVAFRCPRVEIETFTAASDGALWFTSRHAGGRRAGRHHEGVEADPGGEVALDPG